MNTVNITDNGIRRRGRYLLRQCLFFGAAGVLYYCFIRATGVYIPCIFRTVTGLKCPGCGISHSMVALIQGRLGDALESNPLVTCLLPFGLIYGAYRAYIYVRYGRTDYRTAETVLLFIILIITLVFGVWRNL